MTKSSKLVLRQILSELMVNLAAGWYGAAVIIPATSDKPPTTDLGILTVNIIFGTVFVIIAYKLRRIKKGKGRK